MNIGSRVIDGDNEGIMGVRMGHSLFKHSSDTETCLKTLGGTPNRNP